MRFCQQFNAGAGAARFLDVQMGSQQYPNFRYRRAAYGDTSVYAAGSATNALKDQDPRIHRIWLDTAVESGTAVCWTLPVPVEEVHEEDVDERVDAEEGEPSVR